MSRLALLAACLAFSTLAPAKDLVLNNPDFEKPMRGDRIPGWSRTQHAGVRAYEVTNDTKSFDKGKSSIRMLRTTEQAYGLIMQQLETPGLAGKTVELVAAVKGEEVGEKGWVMVLTFKNHSNILNEIRAEPVTGTTKWTDLKITKVAPPETTHIEVGFMLLDGGAGWADNVRLRVLDEDKPKAAEDADAEAGAAGTAPAGKPESGKPSDAAGHAPVSARGDH
jgi:hypothetical protein